ncbi:MAG: hypothetical protein GY778_11425 [bacterium]|nr:hypothetical protein [bacterium]
MKPPSVQRKPPSTERASVDVESPVAARDTEDDPSSAPGATRSSTATGPAPVDGGETQLRTHIARLEEQFDELRRQVRQVQQLASLGTAAAMLAHEYNNLVTPAVGYAQYALDTDEPELMRKALTMTLRQTSIITAMADRILGLAVQEPQSFASVNLRQMVDEAVACMARDPAKDGIVLRVNIDDKLTVRADEKQLLQVFFNLLLNARQALTGHGGRLSVEAVARDDDRVEICLRDNGCGIPADKLDSIFEPFVTTKTGDSAGGAKGAGLGLAICRDIIDEHRGAITVQSQVGDGTTFTITLPAAD